jgi:hypothetical protein
MLQILWNLVRVTDFHCACPPNFVHVESDDNYAKFWLEPLDLAKSVGYKNIELSEIRRLIQENMLLLKASWDAHFGS